MTAADMTPEAAALAVKWLSIRSGAAFASDWMPQTGIAVYDGDTIRAAVVVYLERTSPVAVLGWCAANPDNTARQSSAAVDLALSAAPGYARRMGATHLIGMFGNRALNRRLERMGFARGDSMVEQKYIKLIAR